MSQDLLKNLQIELLSNQALEIATGGTERWRPRLLVQSVFEPPE